MADARANPAPRSAHGRLIVVEGTDGVGRDTVIALLREWLEMQGIAVLATTAATSALAKAGLDAAKRMAGADAATLTLLHAAALADAIERQMLPALRAGLVVLADRYVYTPVARGMVRGLDGAWLADLFAFAPPPDAVVYLDTDVEHLTPRVIARGGPGFHESGSDFLPSADRFANFRLYQGLLLQEYREMAGALGFRSIDARGGIGSTFAAAAAACSAVLSAPRGGDAQAIADTATQTNAPHGDGTPAQPPAPAATNGPAGQPAPHTAATTESPGPRLPAIDEGELPPLIDSDAPVEAERTAAPPRG